MRRSGPMRGPSNPRQNPSTIAGITAASALTGTPTPNPGAHPSRETAPNYVGTVAGAVTCDGLRGTTSKEVVEATLRAAAGAQDVSGGIDPLSRGRLPVDDMRR